MEVIDLFRGPTPSLATSRAIVHCRGGEVVPGPGDNPQQSSNLTISSPHKHAAAADLAAVVSPTPGHWSTPGHHTRVTRSRVTCHVSVWRYSASICVRCHSVTITNCDDNVPANTANIFVRSCRRFHVTIWTEWTRPGQGTASGQWTDGP